MGCDMYEQRMVSANPARLTSPRRAGCLPQAGAGPSLGRAGAALLCSPPLYKPKETTCTVGPGSGRAARAASSAGQPGEAVQQRRPKPRGSAVRICLPWAPRRTRAPPEPLPSPAAGRPGTVI